MKRLVEVFARSRIAPTLLLLLIVLGGLSSMMSLRRQLFPTFEPSLLQVTVRYPGAAALDVEEGVCMRIEEALDGLAEIDELRALAREGLCLVTLELVEGAERSSAMALVQNRIDAVEGFPEEIERPLVQSVEPPQLVFSLVVSADADPTTLRRLAEAARRKLLAVPAISQVRLSERRPWQIAIEVEEMALRRLDLTFDDVAEAVGRESLDLPAGDLRASAGIVRLQARQAGEDARDFLRIPVVTRPDGRRVSLGDFAVVRSDFEGERRWSTLDGEPSISLEIYRTGAEDVVDMADQMRLLLDELRTEAAVGVRYTLWRDDSRFLRGQLSLLRKNALAGLALVLVVLTLFLRLHLALWVTLGIPVSFLGTLWVMPWLGLSLNIVTIFAFIVVLGIVVDDAVVVGENIFRHRLGGGSGADAAIAGAVEMASPVLLSVLTTVAAFLPLLMVPGNAGQVMASVPAIAIATLVFSLVECLLILPSHLAHGRVGGNSRLPDLAGALQRWVHGPFRRLLRSALHWRYTTLAAGLAALVLSLGLAAGGHLRFLFFPAVEAENVVAVVTLPEGSLPVDTARAVEHVAASARQLAAELGEHQGRPVIRHIQTSVGFQPFVEEQLVANTGLASEVAGGHLGEVNLKLAPAESRRILASEIQQRWRQVTGDVPGVEELRFDSSLFSVGAPISLELRSDDLDALGRAAAGLARSLGDLPGVTDVESSLRAAGRELQIEKLSIADSLGLTTIDIARQVRAALHGSEVQFLQRGSEEVKVVVRYPEARRRSIADVEGLHVRTPSGAAVPFAVVARLRSASGYARIERTDGERTASITAQLAPGTTAREVTTALTGRILPELSQSHPRVSYRWRGEQDDQARAMAGLAQGFLLALFLIYGLLALAFGSYVQPLLVMAAIPFGLVGAFLGHLLLGLPLTLYSLFGIVALSGVIVNGSLILVQLINQIHAEGKERGMSILDASLEATCRRFRPIALTSLTTFLGLLPLVLERSLQAQFLIPMAVSIAFGILFGTAIILLLVPAGNLVLHDLARLRPGSRRRAA